MTTEETMTLQQALSAYARDHGLAAADALVLNSATDADLARLSESLGDLRNSTGHRVGLGDQQRVTIMRALAGMLDLYEHVETEPWPGQMDVYGGTDASRTR